MATVGTNNLTLTDISRRLNADGKVDAIVEVLNETNDMLEDMSFVECNDGTHHKSTIRTGLPTPTWRKLYGGVGSSKSSTRQVVDSCGMLEALPSVDAKLLELSGDPAGVRLSEERPHIEAMNQAVADTFWYGSLTTTPERFEGIHSRFNVLSTDPTLSGYNVFDGGGTGSDNASVWGIVWGPQTVHMLYPKGSRAGLQQQDLGKQLVDADDSSGKYLAWISHYEWDLGLCVRDWRAVVRICNIDVSNLEAESSAANLVKLMIRASERVKGKNLGRFVWYMPERLRTMLRLQMLGNSNVNLTFDTVEGKEVMRFDGAPVRKSDALLLTESQIT